jgi:hypothetical protein
MSTTTKLLTVFAVIVIILNIWGVISPSHYNWGSQTFAFYPLAYGIIALIVAILLLVPKIQNIITREIDRITKPLSRLPVPILFVGALGLLVFLAFTFPVKGLLLGDSKIILLTTPELPSSIDESANFRNQPLVLLTLRFLEGIVQQDGTQGLKEIYKWFDITGGAIFLLFVFIFLRRHPALNHYFSAYSYYRQAGYNYFSAISKIMPCCTRLRQDSSSPDGSP